MRRELLGHFNYGGSHTYPLLNKLPYGRGMVIKADENGMAHAKLNMKKTEKRNANPFNKKKKKKLIQNASTVKPLNTVYNKCKSNVILLCRIIDRSL